MWALLADLIRFFAWLLALAGGAPLWGSRSLYTLADWVEGR